MNVWGHISPTTNIKRIACKTAMSSSQKARTIRYANIVARAPLERGIASIQAMSKRTVLV